MNDAFRSRNVGDYAYGIEFPEKEAKKTLENAEIFIDTLKQYLAKEKKENNL